MAIVVLRALPRLEIHLYEMVEDIPRTGIMVARRTGVPVLLQEGENEVDDDFWSKWLGQNQQTDLVKKSYVFSKK